MTDELDDDLTPDQWEALKALRKPGCAPTRIYRFAVDSLIARGYVTIRNDMPVITPGGRKVLIRGSSRLLLDLAA